MATIQRLEFSQQQKVRIKQEQRSFCFVEQQPKFSLAPFVSKQCEGSW